MGTFLFAHIIAEMRDALALFVIAPEFRTLGGGTPLVARTAPHWQGRVAEKPRVRIGSQAAVKHRATPVGHNSHPVTGRAESNVRVVTVGH